ncbi:MAG: ACP S-malonyltransferase [Proteobacteria bacterium]|nr:ACP S-malonyltransferase [Pseudomonadota bacterium]
MTKSVTLLFPGQGSQYVGMGKNLDHSLFDKGNEILGYDLKKLMLEGPEEELKLTHNTQPAILKHSLTLLNQLMPVLKKYNVKIDRVLGHSVGEYAALVAAGVLSANDAILAVHLRGKYMQEAVPVGRGKMFAILKVPATIVEEACKRVSQPESEVMPANFNDPSQIVISGESQACLRAINWLSENFKEAHRCMELNVSAPFHSSLMKPAANQLKEAFARFKWHENQIPYIANIDAKEYGAGTNPETIINNLYHQAYGPVLWTQSIEQLPSDTVCIEVGPGKVLMGLVRKINKDIKVLTLDKDEALIELEELLA